jgi:hypothetical protein
VRLESGVGPDDGNLGSYARNVGPYKKSPEGSDETVEALERGFEPFEIFSVASDKNVVCYREGFVADEETLLRDEEQDGADERSPAALEKALRRYDRRW